MADSQNISTQQTSKVNDCSSVEFRSVKGFPGYEIGSDGSVYSHRLGSRRQMILQKDKHGYLYVDLKLRGQKKQRHYAHRLTLRTFVGDPLGNQEARHKDGNPLNNNISNLHWGTRTENILDALKHKTWVKHRGHRNSKLIPNEIRIIRGLWERHPGLTGIQTFLSRWFGISNGQISCICNKKRWRWVE